MLTASTPAVVQAAWHRTVVDTGFVDVTVVTGANSGVGYGVAERLVEKALMAGQGSQRVIVMACRNKRKAEDARERLLEDVARRRRKTSAARGPIPETLVQLLIVDLADTGSVFRACAEFKERFQRLDTIHLNAGILPTAGINLLTGLKNLVTRPSFVAQTGGDVFVQPRGTTTHEGLGTVFAANAFGHYILTMELRDVMTDGAKILWYTSTTASAVRHLDIEDLQCIKGDHPYESSKSVCEILASAPPSVAESESKKAYSFVSGCSVCYMYLDRIYPHGTAQLRPSMSQM
ncbi:hypothetical protein HKX48_009129 [Thoreauomyces humboldtii]|nr:hypothetical protein HKX48_009129 [Thoreauomyces humboldtii]